MFNGSNAAVGAEVSQAREFIPINQLERSAIAAERDARAASQATVAQLRAQSAAYAGALNPSPSRNSVLDLTKPSEDTGDMPAADPFATARLIADETSAVAVPAWFDKAMIDAMDKYRSTNTAGTRGTAG